MGGPQLYRGKNGLQKSQYISCYKNCGDEHYQTWEIGRNPRGKILGKRDIRNLGMKQYKLQPKHESHVRTQTSVPTEN